MFIYNESYNGNGSSSSLMSAGDITAMAYEAILENVIEMADERERMIITEHEAIVNENTYILNEGIKDFFRNIKNKIVELVKKFISWIDKAVSELYYHVKVSGKLQKYKSEISKSINGDYITKSGMDITSIKMVRYQKASEITTFIKTNLDKINTNINTRADKIDSGSDFYNSNAHELIDDKNFKKTKFTDSGEMHSDYEAFFDDLEEKTKYLGLQKQNDEGKTAIPVDNKYLKDDQNGVLTYCSGKPDISIKLIMGLKETRGVLKKIIPQIEKSAKAQQNIYDNYDEKEKQGDSGKETVTMQKNLNMLSRVLRLGLTGCNRMLTVAREKNAQLAKIASLYLKAYNKFMGGGRKQKDLKTSYSS